MFHINKRHTVSWQFQNVQPQDCFIEGKEKSKGSKVAEGVFLISSSHRNEPHKLNIRGPTCTCRSFTTTHFPCQHIFQAIDDRFVKWDDVLDDYRNIPFFNINKDKDCLSLICYKREPPLVIPRFSLFDHSTPSISLLLARSCCMW